MKEVVNCVDGKRLGRIIDIVFDGKSGCVKGIVAPFSRKGFIFKPLNDIFIPWRCVKKIGEDTILVELVPEGAPRRDEHDDCDDHGEHHEGKHKPGRCDDKFTRTIPCNNGNLRLDYSCNRPHRPPHKDRDCDGHEKGRPSFCNKNCEKCRFYDCEYRWQDACYNNYIAKDGDGK